MGKILIFLGGFVCAFPALAGLGMVTSPPFTTEQLQKKYERWDKAKEPYRLAQEEERRREVSVRMAGEAVERAHQELSEAQRQLDTGSSAEGARESMQQQVDRAREAFASAQAKEAEELKALTSAQQDVIEKKKEIDTALEDLESSKAKVQNACSGSHTQAAKSCASARKKRDDLKARNQRMAAYYEGMAHKNNSCTALKGALKSVTDENATGDADGKRGTFVRYSNAELDAYDCEKGAKACNGICNVQLPGGGGWAGGSEPGQLCAPRIEVSEATTETDTYAELSKNIPDHAKSQMAVRGGCGMMTQTEKEEALKKTIQEINGKSPSSTFTLMDKAGIEKAEKIEGSNEIKLTYRDGTTETLTQQEIARRTGDSYVGVNNRGEIVPVARAPLDRAYNDAETLLRTGSLPAEAVPKPIYGPPVPPDLEPPAAARPKDPASRPSTGPTGGSGGEQKAAADTPTKKPTDGNGLPNIGGGPQPNDTNTALKTPEKPPELCPAGQVMSGTSCVPSSCPDGQSMTSTGCVGRTEVAKIDPNAEAEAAAAEEAKAVSMREKITAAFDALLGRGGKEMSTAVAAKRGGSGIGSGSGSGRSGSANKNSGQQALADAPKGAQGFFSAIGRALGLTGKGSSSKQGGKKAAVAGTGPGFQVPKFGEASDQPMNYDRFLPKMGVQRRAAGVQGHPEIAGRHEDIFQNVSRAYRNNGAMLSPVFKTALKY